MNEKNFNLNPFFDNTCPPTSSNRHWMRIRKSLNKKKGYVRRWAFWKKGSSNANVINDLNLYRSYFSVCFLLLRRLFLLIIDCLCMQITLYNGLWKGSLRYRLKIHSNGKASYRWVKRVTREKRDNFMEQIMKVVRVEESILRCLEQLLAWTRLLNSLKGKPDEVFCKSCETLLNLCEPILLWIIFSFDWKNWKVQWMHKFI